jgi:uncharacterized protein YndB with AHSA1/START domain
LALVLAQAALAWGGGLLLSPKFSVSRSVTMQTPPAAVYERIAEPRRWRDWSVWHRRDPTMKVTYFGNDSGAGAGREWKSQREGDGKMTFTTAEPERHLAYDLYFPDFGTTSGGEFRRAPEGSGTRVTWRMTATKAKEPAVPLDCAVRRSACGRGNHGGAGAA